MLRAYGPNCDGTVIDATRGAIPASATWIDLEEPTKAEEKLVETLLGLDVPTPEDLKEIEPSSRLYEQGGVLYMTISVLCGVEEGQPTSAPVAFVLTASQLVTVRYVSPKPVRAFAAHIMRDPDLARDAVTVLYGFLDAIIDRLADELEDLGAEIERISAHIYNRDPAARRIPVPKLTAMLTRIGHAQSLLARVRETAVSTARLLSFLSGSARLKADGSKAIHDLIGSLVADTASLIDHSAFLSNNLIFMQDASLGLISIEQNAAMKLFSWAALVFLPPTLIAGIYGMNFDHMPELHWLHGYPFAVGLMVASVLIPLWYLKRRGWI